MMMMVVMMTMMVVMMTVVVVMVIKTMMLMMVMMMVVVVKPWPRVRDEWADSLHYEHRLTHIHQLKSSVARNVSL